MVNQAEIHRMAQSEDMEERREAVEELRHNFVSLPDREQAWSELHRLIQDKNEYVRREAAGLLGATFPHIPEKYREQALNDLIRLAQDEKGYLRREAAGLLGAAFPHIPEKNREQALSDLIRLSHDENEDVQMEAAYSLVAAFPHIPEKHREQAWNDLIRLTQDKHYQVRWSAAEALGAAFPHIPEKYREQAWNELHRLTQDEYDVRGRAAGSLGAAFPYIPEKHREQAWSDLIRLMQDKDNQVRATAYHSLGRASIFKATEAGNDEDFRKELEKALAYFESSSKEVTYYNPASFCLPFYRSFYAITFRKQEAEEEVKKYLAEAKSAVEGSESKEKLLEAVENLSNALKEAQKARDFDEIKCNLNSYRRYCDRAAELLDATEDKAPGATKLVRRGLPIIDEKIKELLNQTKKDTRLLCRIAGKTEYSEISSRTYKHIENASEASEAGNPIKVDKELNFIIRDVDLFSQNLDTNKSVYLRELIDEISDDSPLLEKVQVVRHITNRLMILVKTPKIIGDVYMGDVFKNIQNATIINKAIVIDSFNKIKKEHDEDVAKALLQIGEFIEKSGDVSAGILFDKFNEEVNKPQPDKSTLRKIWDGIEKTLPTVNALSDVIVKLSPLF